MHLCTITSDKEEIAITIWDRFDVVSISQQLRLCVCSSLPCQRLNYSLGVCLQALGPCRVGLMPAMLGPVCVAVWIDPQPQSQALHWPTSCCKHLRHRTAAWVPVCVYIHVHARVNALHVFMGGRQTAAQNRTSVSDYTILDMIKKTCFMRLPTAHSLNEFINLQMPCCVLHLIQLFFCEDSCFIVAYGWCWHN